MGQTATEDQSSQTITWAAKIPTDLKEELAQYLQEAGLMPRDFLRLALGEVRAKVPGRTNPEFLKELGGFRQHLTRAEEIFLSAVAMAQDQVDAEREKVKQLEEALGAATSRADKATRAAGEAKTNLARALDGKEQAERVAGLAEKAAAAAEARASAVEEEAKKVPGYMQETEHLKKALERATSERAAAVAAAGAAAAELQASANQAKEYRLDAETARAEVEDLRKGLDRADIERDKAVVEVSQGFVKEVGRLQDALAEERAARARVQDDLRDAKAQLHEISS